MRAEPAVAECGLEKGEGALSLYAPVYPYLYPFIAGYQCLGVMDDIAVERRGQISEALMLFGSTKLDYIDCLLLAGFTSAGNDFISFDRKLMNRKRQTR